MGRLATAWVEEATRLRSLGVCACPCGQRIQVRGYKPGHDAKLRSHYMKIICTVLASESN